MGIFSLLSLLSFSVASAQLLFIFLCVVVHNFSPGLDVDGRLLKVCYRTLFKRFVCAARERLTACAVICHGHFYALGARIFKDVNVHPASPPQNREDMSDMASHVILPHGVVSSIRDPRLTIVQQGDQQLHLIYCHFGLARSQWSILEDPCSEFAIGSSTLRCMMLNLFALVRSLLVMWGKYFDIFHPLSVDGYLWCWRLSIRGRLMHYFGFLDIQL